MYFSRDLRNDMWFEKFSNVHCNAMSVGCFLVKRVLVIEFQKVLLIFFVKSFSKFLGNFFCAFFLHFFQSHESN